MAPTHLETIGLTDVGNLRQFNEDRIVLAPEAGVVLVADGMGGHRAGELASRLAAEIVLAGIKQQSLQSSPTPLQLLNESINQANRAIFDAAGASDARQGMGTTLAVALFRDGTANLGHVGDSRIYRLREGRLTLLTRDDSLLREQVDAGLIDAADAADSRNRAFVTQALGVAERVDAHLQSVDTAPGDLFLLCSDGLCDLVDDADIELVMGALAANLPLAAHTLVQAAKDNGGYDNVSVILVRVRMPLRQRLRDRLARIGGWFR